METIRKFCCNCCGKEAKEEKEEEMEETVLTIEDPFSGTKLVEKPAEVKSEPERRSLAPRKHIKLKKKQIERISISGAVAALPPPPIEEIEGEIPKVSNENKGLKLGNGVYLVYSLDENGSLYLKYSNTCPENLDGILGYIRPNREILSFHYEENDGVKVVSRNVREYMKSKFQHDRKKYFDAWLEFLQILNSYGGSLYILAGFNKSPPPRVRIVLLGSNSLTELETCREIVLKEKELLGVFPLSLDYKAKLINGVNRSDFVDLCHKYGAVFELIG